MQCIVYNCRRVTADIRFDVHSSKGGQDTAQWAARSVLEPTLEIPTAWLLSLWC